MTVDTKTVDGRREVHFDSYEQLLADAQRLSNGEPQLVGNWSLGQIFQHLAVAYTGSIDGLDFKVPWYIKFMARTFMKKKFLYGKLPSGFQIPEENRKKFVADESTSTEAGLNALKDAVVRLQTETARVPHPVLGNITNEEWDNWHWRHAEMHMSFAIPAEEAAAVSQPA